VCSFKLPRTIVSDNRTNFVIKWQVFAPSTRSHVDYPQGNSQAEISNHTILDNLRKSLDKIKGKWLEKLPGVLWAYRTTKRVPTGETPFSLAYRIESIISVDISMSTLRVERVAQDKNDAILRLMLDHSEERRQQAQICITAY